MTKRTAERRTNPEYVAGVWNANNAVGAAVEVTLDNGSKQQTKTTSEAWVMGGHSAVVKLEGISGGYSLNRVRAIG